MKPKAKEINKKLLAAAKAAHRALEDFRLHCGDDEWQREYPDFHAAHKQLQTAIAAELDRQGGKQKGGVS